MKIGAILKDGKLNRTVDINDLEVLCSLDSDKDILSCSSDTMSGKHIKFKIPINDFKMR